MMAMLMLPIILILVAVILIMSLFGSALGTLVSGGEVIYDENTYQDYANEMYYAEFGSSDAFEDNILLVFLVDKDFYDYNFIAWVGDDIETKVNYMFGNEQSELGRAIQSSAINSQSYKYSMGQGITQVAEHMQEKISALGLDSNFKCEEDRSKTDSHITNYTDLQINASTVDKALAEFTKATGIPIVVVVEYREEVFGKTISPTDIFLVIIAIGLIVLAIVLIVNAVKKRPKGDGDDGTYHRNDSSGGYSGDYSGF